MFRSEKRAEAELRLVAEDQVYGEEAYTFCVICPRCGQPRMDPQLARNALSRQLDIYICSVCGTEEALMDMSKMDPLPFPDWSAIKRHHDH